MINNNKGVSLAESLATMVIILVVIIPAISSLITNVKYKRLVTDQNYSAQVSSSISDAVENFNFDTMKSAIDTKNNEISQSIENGGEELEIEKYFVQVSPGNCDIFSSLLYDDESDTYFTYESPSYNLCTNVMSTDWLDVDYSVESGNELVVYIFQYGGFDLQAAIISIFQGYSDFEEFRTAVENGSIVLPANLPIDVLLYLYDLEYSRDEGRSFLTYSDTSLNAVVWIYNAEYDYVLISDGVIYNDNTADST